VWGSRVDVADPPSYIGLAFNYYETISPTNSSVGLKMNGTKYATVGFFCGVIFSFGLLYLSLCFSPWPYSDLKDIKRLQQIAVSRNLEDHSLAEKFYVGGDSERELVETLKKKYPNTEFRSLTERPREHCDLAPCSNSDFLNVNINFPLWRVAKVQVGFFNGATEMTLIKVGSQWHVIYVTGFAI